ncbi:MULTISPECIES: DUF2538 family protein [Paenibacillus]|uniref:DUF2538 family protein n=1 Tax=Paenibacillus TaxID=44249 RepID=UPI000D2FC91C|nr:MULTISPECIES: DUF2538 family protein [Paenibacillus]KAF6614310.1 DUF2538 family protein [Paenibacillus sp. EKM101P]KAF6616656.1 DUF2538 family protein [Paenibacillus sp. EKM102P]KAF6625110.1 DUF2538 family protein [Paenibacillus sp. EKM10P]KAF6640975.1 DUF2538 family protein [Paenibacillus sp. EKM11P]PTU44259.1 hypothetical protein DBL67_24310 [Paenibacillus polymyxa]
MFFVNEAHRKNYESLLEFYASSLPSIEYEVACYILALPEVLKRIPEEHSFKFAFDWVHHWEDENDESTKRLSDAIFTWMIHTNIWCLRGCTCITVKFLDLITVLITGTTLTFKSFCRHVRLEKSYNYEHYLNKLVL